MAVEEVGLQLGIWMMVGRVYEGFGVGRGMMDAWEGKKGRRQRK